MTPIIVIESGKESALTARKLQMAFLQQEYYAAVFSTCKNDFLCGVCYLPEALLSDYLRFFSAYQNVDILFIITASEAFQGDDDVFLKIQQSKYLLKYRERTRNLSDITELLNEIISIYA